MLVLHRRKGRETKDHGMKFSVIFQRGKLSITTEFPNGYGCRSVVFNSSFVGHGPTQVQASAESSTMDRHGGVAIWVESLSSQKFKACVLRNGEHVNNTVKVNWFAVQSTPQEVLKGSLSFGLFTSGTKCRKVTFNNLHAKKPRIFVTVRHQIPDRVQDSTTVWVRDIKRSAFTVCMREMRIFSGGHMNIVVDWLAIFERPESLNVTETGEFIMKNIGQPQQESNFAFCQRVRFGQPHYSAPVVIATADHLPTNGVDLMLPKYSGFNIWIESVTTTDFHVCVKDLVSYGEQHDPVKVHYMVFGDLDPCINVTCLYHAVCKAFGPYDERCVCVTDCSSIVQTVCASNGQTFDNKCLLELEICQNKHKYTYYHPGGCRGFPVLKGHHELRHVPNWTESKCDVIQLKPYTFYPHKKVHVQLTVNYVNHTASNFVHAAVAPWVEDVSDKSFTVCVQVTGRNSRSQKPLAAVDWLAYQGSPIGGLVGVITMGQWWSGTNCKSVNFPKNTFLSTPTILLTAEHKRFGIVYDAGIVWAQEVSKGSFKACVRELQSFDGLHRNINLNWLAYEEIDNPLFSEHGSTSFNFNSLSSDQTSSAECKTTAFTGVYKVMPTVLIAVTHTTSGANSVDPASNGITAWVESMNLTHFKVCSEEYYVKKYDSVIVQYTVLTDVCPSSWHYFRGFCYFTEPTCTGWSNASTFCQSMGADLVSVKDQEENVYIQHLHGGEKTWIGLTDIATEGKFVWSDNLNSQFRYWAHRQPDNYGNADCVHTLGIGHHYRWDDVLCTKCLPSTCKKDYNECQTSPCLNGGTCSNMAGNYSCKCTAGYTGKDCKIDINECLKTPCHNSGTCINSAGSYVCKCVPGYAGKNCQTDINECASNPCLNGGNCTDKINGYKCTCTSMYCGTNCEKRKKQYWWGSYRCP